MYYLIQLFNIDEKVSLPHIFYLFLFLFYFVFASLVSGQRVSVREDVKPIGSSWSLTVKGLTTSP